MGRAPCCDKNGLKKGPWTPEEDLKLINYIQTHGPRNWRALPKNAGLERCGKSCRLRWTNYLRPDIKRGRFSFEEEETIIQLHSIMGNKWSAIAARLSGRTDNEIKNYWNTHIRKRLLRNGIDPVTHAPRIDLLDMSSILRSAFCNPSLLVNLQGLLSCSSGSSCSNTQAAATPLVMNPTDQLLKLAATATLLSSLKNENHDLVSQNMQQQIIINDGVNCQLQQNHVTLPLTHQSNMVVNMSCSNSPQNSAPNSYIVENHMSQQNQVDLLQNQELEQFLNNANHNIGYESVRSTPLSTPNSLNSSYVNSSTEEERDTYCSEIFNLEIPESLDISDYL